MPSKNKYGIYKGRKREILLGLDDLFRIIAGEPDNQEAKDEANKLTEEFMALGYRKRNTEIYN